jgi:uncharacterized protein (DUF433 family)
MWAINENWQLSQLRRLGGVDPERVETILNTLWNSYPGLYAELAILAVDQEQLSVDECAQRLGIAPDEVLQRLIQFRRAAPLDLALVPDIKGQSVARIPDYGIAVWEVVREFRKLGSVERLKESFPAVPEGQLAAAMRYAQENPEEIDGQIQAYEDMAAKLRSEYPFS